MLLLRNESPSGRLVTEYVGAVLQTIVLTLRMVVDNDVAARRVAPCHMLVVEFHQAVKLLFRGKTAKPSREAMLFPRYSEKDLDVELFANSDCKFAARVEGLKRHNDE